MKMTELDFDGAQPPIDGYAPGGFRIAGRFLDGPLLLDASGPRAWDGAVTDTPLEVSAATPLIALARELDILLIGVGSEIAPLPAAFRAALERAGLRFDAMGTPAACRTYNVLLTEDRRVGAALLPVGAPREP